MVARSATIKMALTIGERRQPQERSPSRPRGKTYHATLLRVPVKSDGVRCNCRIMQYAPSQKAGNSQIASKYFDSPNGKLMGIGALRIIIYGCTIEMAITHLSRCDFRALLHVLGQNCEIGLGFRRKICSAVQRV